MDETFERLFTVSEEELKKLDLHQRMLHSYRNRIHCLEGVLWTLDVKRNSLSEIMTLCATFLGAETEHTTGGALNEPSSLPEDSVILRFYEGLGEIRLRFDEHTRQKERIKGEIGTLRERARVCQKNLMKLAGTGVTTDVNPARSFLDYRGGRSPVAGGPPHKHNPRSFDSFQVGDLLGHVVASRACMHCIRILTERTGAVFPCSASMSRDAMLSVYQLVVGTLCSGAWSFATLMRWFESTDRLHWLTNTNDAPPWIRRPLREVHSNWEEMIRDWRALNILFNWAMVEGLPEASIRKRLANCELKNLRSEPPLVMARPNRNANPKKRVKPSKVVLFTKNRAEVNQSLYQMVISLVQSAPTSFEIAYGVCALLNIDAHQCVCRQKSSSSSARSSETESTSKSPVSPSYSKPLSPRLASSSSSSDV